MAAKAKVTSGQCSLCGKEDEGIMITVPLVETAGLAVIIFICEGCLSQLFKQFRKVA